MVVSHEVRPNPLLHDLVLWLAAARGLAVVASVPPPPLVGQRETPPQPEEGLEVTKVGVEGRELARAAATAVVLAEAGGMEAVAAETLVAAAVGEGVGPGSRRRVKTSNSYICACEQRFTVPLRIVTRFYLQGNRRDWKACIYLLTNVVCSIPNLSFMCYVYFIIFFALN